MPPLAYRVLKELTLPIKDRTFRDSCGLLKRLEGTHFFDVSEVESAAYELSRNPIAFNGAPATTFLPAPKVWIEHSRKDGSKFAWFLSEKSDGKIEYAQVLQSRQQDYFGTWGNEFVDVDLTTMWSSDGWQPEQMVSVYLLFINSPKVIGRKQYAPHRALERSMIQKMGRGAFPLRAWTEIKLEVGLPEDRGGEPSKETYLTGQKALHFCRSHLRIRLGRLEIVKSHWRGDPALGIVQSRYKVQNS